MVIQTLSKLLELRSGLIEQMQLFLLPKEILSMLLASCVKPDALADVAQDILPDASQPQDILPDVGEPKELETLGQAGSA